MAKTTHVFLVAHIGEGFRDPAPLSPAPWVVQAETAKEAALIFIKHQVLAVGGEEIIAIALGAGTMFKMPERRLRGDNDAKRQKKAKRA